MLEPTAERTTQDEDMTGAPASLVPEEHCCSVVEAIVPRLVSSNERLRRVYIVAVAAVVSLMLHASLGYCLLWQFSFAEMEGAGGQYEGISVELVPGTAVESVAGTSLAQAEAAAQINAASGGEAPKDQAEQTSADTAPQEKSETAPVETIIPDEKPELVAQEEREEKQQEETPKPDPGESNSDVKQTALEKLDAGGATARGVSQSSTASEASVAASPGEMSRYAAGLHAAIIRNRPRHVGHSGSVTILFALTSTGGLRSAEVVKSNGDAHLEHLALESLRRVRFPPPPPRANERQLFYTTTIRFR